MRQDGELSTTIQGEHQNAPVMARDRGCLFLSPSPLTLLDIQVPSPQQSFFQQCGWVRGKEMSVCVCVCVCVCVLCVRERRQNNLSHNDKEYHCRATAWKSQVSPEDLKRRGRSLLGIQPGSFSDGQHLSPEHPSPLSVAFCWVSLTSCCFFKCLLSLKRPPLAPPHETTKKRNLKILKVHTLRF